MFIDSHAHITDPLLKSKKEEIIKNMPQNNIGIILNVGYNIKNSQDNVNLCKKHGGGLLAAVGIHPSYASECNSLFESVLEEMAKNEKVVAIGEIGLDYHYENFNKTAQHKLFLKQIKIAHKLKLPVIIHLRDAEEDCRKILSENINMLKNGVLFHCFCAGEEFLNFALKTIENVYFAFGGAATFKKGLDSQISACPLDRLLIETDCPYLTPEPLRGKCLNEPKHIKYIYEKVADIKNVTIKELEDITEKNFKRLFKC